MQFTKSISAQTLTRTLNGKWHGRYGTAPCPVCQPERRRDQSALTISDGTDRLLAHCHKSNCDFRDILAAAGVAGGSYSPPDPALAARRMAEQRAEAERKSRQARAVWDETATISGSLAETYLRGRGITGPLPESLRFHPACFHGPTAKRFPAMVARIDGGDGFAVHRTFLHPDGGKVAKTMLGPMRGGAVKLRHGLPALLVGEGIESTLSAAQLLNATGSVWAALSAAGMRTLTLPKRPAHLVVAVDGDAAGREAGKALAERATVAGWTVEIADPGDGLDANDLLNREAMA